MLSQQQEEDLLKLRLEVKLKELWQEKYVQLPASYMKQGTKFSTKEMTLTNGEDQPLSLEKKNTKYLSNMAAYM